MIQIKSYIHNSLQEIYSKQELNRVINLLLMDLLDFKRQDILSNDNIILTTEQNDLLEDAIGRLKINEPIQYVLGRAYFYGNYFRVERGVLIPRPETEELVDIILKNNKGKYRMLDIGTGSGCIAISVSKNNSKALVDAWDVSDRALEIAKYNNQTLKGTVQFSHCDILSITHSLPEKYDVIVSNPPYITYEEKKIMDNNVLDWEPNLALFVPDDNPLLFYRKIAKLGLNSLFSNGRLYFEINQLFGKEVVNMLDELGYQDIQLLKDMFGNDRFVIAKL